jgi:hypothetical protein
MCIRVFGEAKCVSDVRHAMKSRPAKNVMLTLLFDAIVSTGSLAEGTIQRGSETCSTYSTPVSTS